MASLQSRLHFAFFLLALLLSAHLSVAQRPNIVFILTDDQDMTMHSLDYMPLLQKHLVNQGTSYPKHYCTIAICCPSRVNMWTGMMSHNTNITDVVEPFGGYTKFVAEGFNEKYIPVWLQEAGYNTYYTGKLLNGQTTDNYNNPVAGGFTGSDFLLDPYTYLYYNARMSRNGGEPVVYDGQYSPDLIAQKAYGFLNDAVAAGKPFFLGIAPIAPHSEFDFNGLKTVAPKYPPRHANLFNGYKIPRTRNFNPDTPSGVNWIAKLPKLNSTLLDYNDNFQRDRLRSLQSVDEMIEGVVNRLSSYGILNNTYIFYTSDNGFHIGQHMLPPGKGCGYEEDINVPLIIRGPGVPKNQVSRAVTSHTDIAPTLMKIASGNTRLRPGFDGAPIPFTFIDPSPTEQVGVEYWGNTLQEGAPYGTINSGNTYKAVRVVGLGYSIYYSVWCTNERELYNMDTDPDQMNNLIGTSGIFSPILFRSIDQVTRRLDTLLLAIKSCKGNRCVKPWKTIHPNGLVLTLPLALNPLYDFFYSQQPKVSFSSCEQGYFPSKEGPQKGLAFDLLGSQPWARREVNTSEKYEYYKKTDWSFWT